MRWDPCDENINVMKHVLIEPRSYILEDVREADMDFTFLQQSQRISYHVCTRRTSQSNAHAILEVQTICMNRLPQLFFQEKTILGLETMLRKFRYLLAHHYTKTYFDKPVDPFSS